MEEFHAISLLLLLALALALVLIRQAAWLLLTWSGSILFQMLRHFSSFRFGKRVNPLRDDFRQGFPGRTAQLARKTDPHKLSGLCH